VQYEGTGVRAEMTEERIAADLGHGGLLGTKRIQRTWWFASIYFDAYNIYA
jgi:hypothetical protein